MSRRRFARHLFRLLIALLESRVRVCIKLLLLRRLNRFLGFYMNLFPVRCRTEVEAVQILEEADACARARMNMLQMSCFFPCNLRTLLLLQIRSTPLKILLTPQNSV